MAIFYDLLEVKHSRFFLITYEVGTIIATIPILQLRTLRQVTIQGHTAKGWSWTWIWDSLGLGS